MQAAAGGGEPSDAIRAVNALLTQLDQLRRFPNVMVLTTSNITEAIDVAFVDRADIKVRRTRLWCAAHSIVTSERQMVLEAAFMLDASMLAAAVVLRMLIGMELS